MVFPVQGTEYLCECRFIFFHSVIPAVFGFGDAEIILASHIRAAQKCTDDHLIYRDVFLRRRSHVPAKYYIRRGGESKFGRQITARSRICPSPQK